MYPNNFMTKHISKGFTLIETIIGIVLLSISFSLITTLIYPLTEQSADQLHQIRAAELGQSMLNEIQNKAFDEKSDKTGGNIRCGEPSETPCTLNVNLGPDNTGTLETRSEFDDVDDYNNLNYAAGKIENSQGVILDSYYGFSMTVSVCNDSDYDGDCSTNANNHTAKWIKVKITTPTDFDIVFSTYRANF